MRPSSLHQIWSPRTAAGPVVSASSRGAPESAGTIQSAPFESALVNTRLRPSGDQWGKKPNRVRSSGFCQTLMVSAKPVALFGAMDPPPFGQADLLRLAMVLVVPFVVLLIVFATLVWPLQGLPLR